MTTSVPGAVTTGDQRAELVGPLKFWSARDPWEVLKCDDGGLIVCSKGDVICHSDRNHGRDDPADLALFPMLAAAPELLVALKRAERVYVTLIESGDCGHWDANKDENVISMRAAIAKAEQA